MKSGFAGAIFVLLAGSTWAVAQGQAPISAAPPTSGSIAPVPNTGSGPPIMGNVTYPAGPNYPVAPSSGPVLNGNMPTLSGSVPTGPSYLPAGGCAPGGGCMFYADLDYLLYDIRASHIPATAATAPIGLLATPVANQTTTVGATGIPMTTTTLSGTSTISPISIGSNVSFGSNRIDYGAQNGGRLTIGCWLDSDMSWGLEASGFVVQRGIDHFSAIQAAAPNEFLVHAGTANQFVVTTTPATTTVVAGAVVTTPAITTTVANGSTALIAPRESVVTLVGNAASQLYGGEVNARCVKLRYGCVDFGGLLGFRYLGFDDELTLFNNTHLFLPSGFSDPRGVTLSNDLNFSTVDNIRVLNNFYGGQAGIDMDAKFGSCFIYVRGTVAAGDMVQHANVQGTTQIINNDPTHPPGSSTSFGGLLASPGDVGGHTRNHISFIPELNLKVGYQFTSWLRGYVGYDALSIGSVARASDTTTINTINSTVNVAGSNNMASISQPTFRFQDHDVFVQGLTFGLELRY